MKNYIKKISYLLLSLTLLLGSCEVEDSLVLTSPDATFTLNTPGISAVFLNFALPNNPAFTLSWKDEINAEADYTIEIATDADFTTPFSLGTSTNSNFSMTVDTFNNAINNAGVTSFRDVAIYMRVKTSSNHTNAILLMVTTYPIEAASFENIADGDSFVLTLANNDVEAVNITWNDPILASSLSVDIDYVLEAATPGTDFAMPIEIGKVKNINTLSLTHAKLNAFAMLTGVPADTAGALEVRLIATITDSPSNRILERITTAITINVTTYLTVLDLSTNWGVVGSAANDWGATPDLPFFKTAVDGVLNAFVTLTDGEFKFRENNEWTNSYGSTSSSGGTVTSSGANIPVTAGSYKIVLDLNNLNYSIEKFSIGIVGGAYNDWGATPDFMLTYDPYSDVFRGLVTLINGEMKFRMNSEWDTNYGDDGANGTFELNGANIAVTAGKYFVTLSMKDFTYTLEPVTNVWGIVGAAYNDWGATADAQFKRDWSQPFNDVWIAENVTLTAGEYKFRANNEWETSYGDDGADGTLENGGANLVTAAGIFRFTLDFSNPEAPTYTKN
jgi:hypothetical protein